jgi:hypothetical protein
MRYVQSSWKGIAIHHSLTEDSQTLSWEAIRRYHVETNGWSDIGYHFGVELVGTEIFILAGRGLQYEGAHTKGLNGTHIGVCVVGNYDIITPSGEHLIKLANLCNGLMRIYDIDPINIVYHSEYAPKSCPGNKFPKELFKDIMKQYSPQEEAWLIQRFIQIHQ